jgi:DNA polymerase-1
VDGNNLFWRAIKRLPPLTTPSQERVEGIYGFLKSLHLYAEEYEPVQILVCWDSGSPAYRLSIFPGYKSNRKKNRDESREGRIEFQRLTQQRKVIEELLPLLGVKQVSYPNVEADDLLAVASRVLGGRKIIISGDRDLFQLIRKGIQVYNPNHRFLYTRSNFKLKTGLTPLEWYTMRVLSGDTSDGIPPIRRGVGEVTAKKIINREKTIEITDEMRLQFEINKKLMQLKQVDNETKLRAIVGHQLRLRLLLNPAAVKRFFINRAFISLLADFGNWIQPFQGLK